MNAPALDVPLDSADLRRRDWRTIGLIGAAHACSHFFQLVLPTLYLSLAAQYGYDFVKLGLLASAFFLVSCLGQASSGFVVDRIGPAPVLRFGLACFVLSGVLIGASAGYPMLMLAALVGGAGNSVFHPVDYSIINHRVSMRRLGHAFSAHGLTGNLGWALTPVFMAGIIHVANWRVAAFAAAALVACVLLLTWLGRGLLEGGDDSHAAAAARGVAGDAAEGAANGNGAGAAQARPAPAREPALRTLATLASRPALWGAFLFFACTAMALSAVQNYTIPMLGQVYGLDKVLAGSALSAYMLAAALGMLAGGFLVAATPNTERTIAVSLVLAGLLLVWLASGTVASSWAVAVVALAGFCSGVSSPSRDMLIRRVTPKGAVGTVYGLVYSGMDVGSSLGPVGFGVLLDAGYTQGPWLGAAMGFVAAALLALWVARFAARPVPAPAAA
ncbi:MFS transporter [Candidimonas nitroreducens]|uniref:MFS transporter n=1 Tax=Candidimonas nitroreducens TaxID=683354 RepID=A0A225MWJ1_9BURK|nr:MFS transporter [Candidimonas nitroreducens]OWT65757.1 MFS transporter [Candidimonas nitroreducens]